MDTEKIEQAIKRLREMRLSIKNQKDCDTIAIIIEDDDTDILFYAIKALRTVAKIPGVIEYLRIEADRWNDSGSEYNDKYELGISDGFENAIDLIEEKLCKIDEQPTVDKEKR